MAKEPKYGATLNGWERLLTSMEANPEDFQALEAAKQESTRSLRELLVDGRKLATFLRGGVKQRYGDKSEKLVEFGLAPARPRTRASGEPKPPATPPPTPNPATA